MTTRSRTLTYGALGILIVAGAVCGAVIHGLTGQILAFVLLGLGLVGLAGMAFYEVGLSEDRERDRERRARERAEKRKQSEGRPVPRHRLGRFRGERRRLR